MATEVVTPRTPFFHSDLPVFMGALAEPRLFHTDRHGDHLYEFKPEGRYEFAEAVQNALSETGSINGWNQFVLLIYSFISTAWYAQKINSIYQDKSQNGENADFNERLLNIMKGINEDRTVSGSMGVRPSSSFVEREPVVVETPEEIRASVSSPTEEFSLSSDDQARIKVFGKLDNESSLSWVRLSEELGVPYAALQTEVSAWKAKLPESLRYEGFGKLLYNSTAYHAFSLSYRLAKLKGVETKEIQGGFESFFQREVKLRLDQ